MKTKKARQPKSKRQIQVNSIVELNDNQLQIIISGINNFKNSYIREIIETTFNVIINGDCERCSVAAPIEKYCVCYDQDYPE